MHSHAYDKLVYFKVTLKAIGDEGKRFPIMCHDKYCHNNKGVLNDLTRVKEM